MIVPAGDGVGAVIAACYLFITEITYIPKTIDSINLCTVLICVRKIHVQLATVAFLIGLIPNIDKEQKKMVT